MCVAHFLPGVFRHVANSFPFCAPESDKRGDPVATREGDASLEG